MEPHKVYRAIGLMSGTSLDGVDAALLETDGYGLVRPLGFVFVPYEKPLREALRACLGKRDAGAADVAKVTRDFTRAHVVAVDELLGATGQAAGDIDIIGFHGQTLTHDPKHHFTLQIGDGAMLARETGIDVVNDFRSADVAAGGQGAPFLPLYHKARVVEAGLPRPLAILNIGGVSNVTWSGAGEDDLIAFDTGPGNALVDDFILSRTGKNFDEGGKLAKAGEVDLELVEAWMKLPYFTKAPPKSLDRNNWSVKVDDELSTENGAATLAAFSVAAVVQGAKLFPEPAKQWLVTGGGRLNKYMMDHLQIELAAPVKPVEEAGWNGDAMEAEGFGYLAVRSLLGEPLSVPGTTGVHKPLTGGVLYKKP